MNDIVGNLLAVLTAGGVTPVKGQDNNLRDAIASMIAAGTIPVGSMTAFPATAAPAGWLKANGSILSRTTYAALFAYAVASGNYVTDAAWLASRPGSFSQGDGSTTFRIPDFRGLFMRGFHDGSSSYETNTGVLIGQYRDSQIKAHTHSYATSNNNTGGTGLPAASIGGSAFSSNTDSTGATEGFPRHAPALFCIKY